jgi:hypothetical protein
MLEGDPDDFETIIGGKSAINAPDSPKSPFRSERRRGSWAWTRGELNIQIRNSFGK